jgi:ribosomal protein S18 acetylase RimI-like enzyme
MTRPFAIRSIQEGDAPQILLLAKTLHRWFTPQGLSALARDLESHGGFLAVQVDRILGFITWAPADEGLALLSWIGVALDHRRRGIGRTLLSALVASLREKGYRSLEVHTVADNVDYQPYAETRRFYRATGFVDHRIDEKFWGEGDDRYDRLVMRRDLTK